MPLKLTKEEIIEYVEQLCDAFDGGAKNDKETIKNILLNENLNSSDVLSIMTSYPGKKDALAKDIKKIKKSF